MRKILFILLSSCVYMPTSPSQEVTSKSPEVKINFVDASPYMLPAGDSLKPSTSTLDAALPVPKPPACQDGFSHVAGNYCPDVRQTCIDFMDNPALPYARCKKFAKSECLSKQKEHMDFCISTEELYDEQTKVPHGDKSLIECREMCEAKKARLCSAEEWTFACEGEEILPYPYGYERQSTWCNMDTYDTKEKPVACGKVSCDYRAKIDLFPKCKSPFGVHNMTGNVDEWVITKPYSHSMYPGWRLTSGLKGGHWMPVRNRCRPVTQDHHEYFKQITIGCRCCAETR